MMAMQITDNYQMYAAQNSAADKLKKKDAEKAAETANGTKAKSTDEYMNELAKLVPSVECRVGTGMSSTKNGKTLTINPQLLEKMQNDPAVEKEMKELIKGVESAVNLLDSVMNASGWTVVFKNGYIDENGKYSQISLVRNDFMLNLSDKLREERRENAEELIEETRERSAEMIEELQELLEEKISEEEEETTDKAEQLLNEKMVASKDGMLYLGDEDFKTIIEAAREKEKEKNNTKGEDENSAPQKLWERNRNNGRDIADKSIIKQVAGSLSAKDYGSKLTEEVRRLGGQRQGSDTYDILGRAEDAVRAYANLYDEIVQGYRNGTRERYVEDDNSVSGFRKMTMEEELGELDQVFQKMADEADVKDMITGEFKRLSRRAAEAYKKLQKAEEAPKETMGQKMKKLAEVWKDVYQISGSKEEGMEEVLSMLHDIFLMNGKQTGDREQMIGGYGYGRGGYYA